MTEEVFSEKYKLLRNIDAGKKVDVTREGRVEGCPDMIIFDPYELTTDPVFSASFRGWIKEHYGVEEIDRDFINNTTSLEFDYDFLSFEDILYFPNLKKIELGKNRYLTGPPYLALLGDSWNSSVSEMEKSEYSLGIMQELNGLRIERYHQHYFPATTSLKITEMGLPTLPTLNYLSTEGWNINHSQEGVVMDTQPLKNLLDNNQTSCWQTRTHGTILTYDITIDMQKIQEVKGIKIAQALNPLVLNTIPASAQIETSVNGYEWEMFTITQNNTLGNAFGEVTLFRLNAPKQVRYIKVTVTDLLYGTWSIGLGDIAVF